MKPKSDNNKALKDFFDKEYHSLKMFVGSKLKESVNRDPEDIIQDVALKLFSGADRYSPINNVAGFVYRAIKNKIIDVMRSNNRQTITQDNQNEAKLIEFAQLIYDTSDKVYPEQMENQLKKAIMNLKPNYRDIIIAIDFEGYTYKEIALETDIPVGTLMSRRHRAISLLYKTLKTKKEIIN
jgi:RNA polymerase sigma-70 factor (ECF subfamily)